ncbi:MAG: hypothetical protein R2865_14185 [Deinococcales bacterium]
MGELEKSEHLWRFNVVRCRYAELYQALGMSWERSFLVIEMLLWWRVLLGD